MECATATPFSDYERRGFGTDAVWFSNAVIHIPWEGSSSISSAELLHAPDAALSPIHVDTTPAADCPGTERLNDRVARYRTAIVSGRGRLSDNGLFLVECVCSVEKVANLTEEQAGRLYAGPRPK